MASFLKKATSTATGAVNKATGKDEIAKLNDELAAEKRAHDATKKELGATKAALGDAELALAQERSRAADLQLSLNELLEEKAAAEAADAEAAEAERAAAQEAARQAMEAMALEEAVKAKATEDAQAIYEATSGLVLTDDKALATIIGSCSNAQLQTLKSVYMSNFGVPLEKRLRKKTGGSLRTLLLALIAEPVEYKVSLLHDALSGVTTDKDVVIDLLAPASNEELASLAAAYEAAHGKKLAEHVDKNVGGDVGKLLATVLLANRDAEGDVDEAKVAADAEALHAAGEGKTFGTDEKVFITILGNRSFGHIRAMNAAYATVSGKERTLEEAVAKEFGGHMQRALLNIVRASVDRANHYAEKAHDAMRGVGCDELSLIRVVVTNREEIGAIKAAFNAARSQPWPERLAGEVSGALRVGLLLATGEAAE